MSILFYILSGKRWKNDNNIAVLSDVYDAYDVVLG
jgi:hypothetical protein